MLTTKGMKDSDVYTLEGVGNATVALSALLVRGVSSVTIEQELNKIIDSCVKESELEDLLLLAFQVRDVRGGKGERDIFKHMMNTLLENPITSGVTLDLIEIVPEYGCWQDVFGFRYKAGWHVNSLIRKQFEEDEAALMAYNANPSGNLDISLLAKWMPREGQDGANTMATLLVPGSMFHATRMKHYRKRVAALNKALDTVEIKMCANTWADIKPSKVPGRAGKKYVKAFLNEQCSKRGHLLRHPEDPDRMTCRKNFQLHFQKTASGERKAKGADTLFPHEVVKKAVNKLSEMDESEKDHLRGIWKAMVETAKLGGGLGRSLAMCDFSGSMMGSYRNGDTPFWVSMALGLLISEVTTKDFKNTFLTFDSTPQLHTLPEGDLFQKLASFDPNLISQGLSTDFQKAMDLVLAQCKEKRVMPGQEPENLIVLTDMAWDKACGSSERNHDSSYRHVVKTEEWQTHVEMIREAFKRAGEDMWGYGYGLKMPTIVIWNIAATCQDFHATATTPGVVMISGWSPSLFKILQQKGVANMTPHEALRIQLDDVRYDLVRQKFRNYYKPVKHEPVIQPDSLEGSVKEVELPRPIPQLLRQHMWSSFLDASPMW